MRTSNLSGELAPKTLYVNAIATSIIVFPQRRWGKDVFFSLPKIEKKIQPFQGMSVVACPPISQNSAAARVVELERARLERAKPGVRPRGHA